MRENTLCGNGPEKFISSEAHILCFGYVCVFLVFFHVVSFCFIPFSSKSTLIFQPLCPATDLPPPRWGETRGEFECTVLLVALMSPMAVSQVDGWSVASHLTPAAAGRSWVLAAKSCENSLNSWFFVWFYR